MSRPTGFISWSTGGGAIVAEPTGGKKAAGFASPELPSDGEFNWILKRLDEWIQFLDGEVSELRFPPTTTYTWTGKNLTQIDAGTFRIVIAYSGRQIATIQLRQPSGTLVATYTPTVSGRKITAWTRS